MRSTRFGSYGHGDSARTVGADRMGRRVATRSGLGLLAAAVLLSVFAPLRADAQSHSYDFSDDPLLASAVGDYDVELRGRYVRQWTEPQGTLVVIYIGGFQATIGQRAVKSRDAVIWITPSKTTEGQPYLGLTLYLSGDAEIKEPGGTVTSDHILLMRGVNTHGQVTKLHDAHVEEDASQTALYEQALIDLERTRLAEAEGRPSPDIVRPGINAQRPPRVIRYRLPQVEPAETATHERVFVGTGGVYFSQDGGPDSAVIEIRADHAVVFPAEQAGSSIVGAFAGEPTSKPAEAEATPQPTRHPPEEEKEQRGGGGLLGVGEGTSSQVRAVYLEGDVVLSAGTRFIRAHRLYYDFENERALILDAVFRADIPERGIPLYVRASEIRQLSAREFSAGNAVVTTSEFYTPHYHIGAEKIVIRDVTQRDAQGDATTPVAGTYEMTNTTLNVEGVPVLWWPKSAGRLEETETLMRSFSTGYSSDFGAKIETSWNLFALAGVQPPPGYQATLNLDYFSRRGPAIGVDVDYQQDDHFGLFRGYYIHDDGEDDLGPLRRDAEDPSTSERGRVLWRHRHYLPEDWEVTFEVSYISDDNWLEEYRRSEFQEDKDQETLVYLKHVKDTEAITFLANWRLLDFYTQTEHLPDLTYRRIGDLFGPVVSYTEARIGAVRYLPDDRHYLDERRWSNQGRSDLTSRQDARQEFEWPVKLGAVRLVPFATFRGSYWDGQPLGDGGLWRGMGTYGVRGSTSLSREYNDVHSELLDVNRIRHVVQPDFAAWWSHSNTRSELITPFDYGIETIDAFYGMTAGMRQTWQTKRGPLDAQRTVDLLKLNLELGLFGNTDGRDDISNGYANPLRPENSRTRNYFAGDLQYRLSDTTSFLYDFNVDLNDLSYDRHDIAIAIERNPRLAYVLGLRYAGDIEMNLVGGGWNYQLTEKHLTAVRAWWDIDTGQLGEVTVAYVRKLPRWYMSIALEYDNIDDDFGVSLSLWPEGVPEWTLGSRRFTPLGTSTAIRP